MKWLLSELSDMDPIDERFDAKVTVLIENVRHHIEEEETEFFPKVRKDLGRSALADLGTALAEAKKSAPTRPHPRSPDVPPANVVVGMIAGVIDRVSDNISGIAQGGVSAAQDLIARVLNTRKPKFSPTGSSVARGRANGVRGTASTAADGAQETARSVKSGAVKTARVGIGRYQGHRDDGEEICSRDLDHREARRNDSRPNGADRNEQNCDHRQACGVANGRSGKEPR